MSLLLAVIADSPRAAYVTLHAPKEDTPLRDFVKRLQFKPVSYARRAVCTAYTPLPSQEAFQLDVRALRANLLKALETNRRLLHQLSPSAGHLNDSTPYVAKLEGEEGSLGVEVGRWDELEESTQETMVSMAHDFHSSEGFSRSDWTKLLKGLDVGDELTKVGDPRMKYVMHFSDAVQMDELHEQDDEIHEMQQETKAPRTSLTEAEAEVETSSQF